MVIRRMSHCLAKALVPRLFIYILYQIIQSILYKYCHIEVIIIKNTAFFIPRKYFHKAICQSGNALDDWAIQKHPEEKTRKLAKQLGCTETDPKAIIKYLKGFKDTAAVHAEYMGTMSPDEKRRGLPMPFKPTVEISTVSIYRRMIISYCLYHTLSFCNFSQGRC